MRSFTDAEPHRRGWRFAAGAGILALLLAICVLSDYGGYVTLHPNGGFTRNRQERHSRRETYWGRAGPIGKRPGHDKSERYVDAYLSNAVRTNGLDVRLLRLFNIYVLRMKPSDGRAVRNFCPSASRNEPLAIYGDESQTRSFSFVDNFVAVIHKPANRRRFTVCVVDIGNSRGFTIREVAKSFAYPAGSKLEPTKRPQPPNDPPQRRPAISVAQEVPKAEVKIALWDCLNGTLARYRKLVIS